MSRINIEDRFQVIRNGRMELILDAKQIYPDDPGMGTPALFQYNGETMTAACAMDNIEELCDNHRLCDWARELEDDIDAWLTHHTKLKVAATSKKS